MIYILNSKASPGFDIINPFTIFFFGTFPIYSSLNLTDSVASTDHSFPFIIKYPPKSLGSSYNYISSYLVFPSKIQYFDPTINGIYATIY